MRKPPPPPFNTHDVFITRSESGHMGSVFAGRMILDVALYSLKKCGGWGGRMGLKSSITVVRVKPFLLMVRCS